MDLSTLTPVKTEAPDRRRGTTAGPNPFLDNNWLSESYKDKQWREVTVTGKQETYIIKRGKEQGKEATKLTGDAGTVVKLLRDAADMLGLGVSIEVIKGKKVGTFTVKYLGKVRKAAPVKVDDTDEDTTE